MQRVEFARRQALDAYERANECMDTSKRDEWLKAAALWETIARQYEMLLNLPPDYGSKPDQSSNGNP